MIIGNREYDTNNHTYVCGILNVTPDSFSDGGLYQTMDQALERVELMINEGADLIDIGGESTRPGYVRVSDDEEIERTAPVIERIKKEFDIPVSLDTYKSGVAAAGIKAGADLINDIWGLKGDPNMADVISRSGCACCLMHNRDNTNYNNFIADIKTDLEVSIDMAVKAGIDKNKIILDPGVGFGKEYIHNLLVIKNMDEFVKMGYPVLLGTSRKSVIGLTLDVPTKERLEGTLVTTVLAVQSHTGFVRVHDVSSNVKTIKMAEAIRDARE